MTTGDPKKAIPLAIVALLVVGMAVFQFLPKAEGKVRTRQAPAAAVETGTDGSIAAVTQRIEQELKADPFYHPKLKKGDDKTAEVAPPTKPRGIGSKPPSELTGDFGRLPATGDIGGADLGTRPLQPPTGDITGIDQQSQGGTKKVVLEGIVSVNKQKAFLSVDGGEAQGYTVGQKIPEVGTVTFVTESMVVIRTLKRTLVLKVGQEGQL